MRNSFALTALLFSVAVAPVIGCGHGSYPPCNHDSGFGCIASDGRVGDGGFTQPDMTSSASYCRGTLVDGTCAQAFFAPVNACVTFTGPCMQQMITSMSVVGCWQSGGRLAVMVNGAVADATWSERGVTCMSGQVAPPATGGSGNQFTLQANRQTLVYNDVTGAVVCPDGSTANIGPSGSDCAELKSILAPSSCPTGTCP